MRKSLSPQCHLVIFRGSCGRGRQTEIFPQQCKLYYCSLSPQCHSVIFRGRCGSGRLTCIHTQQYKLLHYYKNCVLILMRVTAAISHPHPALPACQNAFHNSLARGQAGLPKYISRFIGKWAGPPAESVINSPTVGRQASPTGRGFGTA